MLDMRTVIIGYMLSNLACMVLMAVLWHQNRRRFAGLGLWMADFILQFVGLLLISLRGSVPDFLSVTIGSAAVVGGTLLLLLGLERFTGRKGPQVHNYVLFATFLAGHAFYTYVRPVLEIRNILISSALLTLCLQSAWLLLRRVEPGLRRATKAAGYVFVVFCVVSVLRIVVDANLPADQDFFHSNTYDTALMMTYQVLYVLLLFSLFLLVNRCLFDDKEREIAIRELAEAALTISEERYAKAFQSSPDAILITRLADSRIVEVNEGFCRLTGLTREQALAQPTGARDFWLHPDDRERVLDRMLREGHVRDEEVAFTDSLGRNLDCLYSGEILELNGQRHVFSVVRDITDRKRSERILDLRLNLWEYSTAHPFHELMQKALDEIEVLTDSRIGFYHFVDEEAGTLSLQAWSTRTMAEYCKAEGAGMEYAIAKAGVWVDCVRERAPVIHNDYASMPGRRGLPEGHAALIRELVVPTMRDGHAVAILGVGNKPSAYTRKDVELVSYIADLVWTIVEKRRADERIVMLNAKLEEQAMTDELTGLRNRRFFFLQGEKEVARAARHGSPLTILMMDLDGFKAVNDLNGHEAGDAVLKAVSATIMATLRGIDTVARLGGEEFGVLLPETSGPDALVLAERLRAAVERLRCRYEGRELTVTASIGAASLSGSVPDLEAVLRKADTAMYHAKETGKNTVYLLD